MDDSWLACLMMKELSKQFELMTLGSESLGMKLMAEVVKAKILQDVKFGSQDTTMSTGFSILVQQCICVETGTNG